MSGEQQSSSSMLRAGAGGRRNCKKACDSESHPNDNRGEMNTNFKTKNQAMYQLLASNYTMARRFTSNSLHVQSIIEISSDEESSLITSNKRNGETSKEGLHIQIIHNKSQITTAVAVAAINDYMFMYHNIPITLTFTFDFIMKTWNPTQENSMTDMINLASQIGVSYNEMKIIVDFLSGHGVMFENNCKELAKLPKKLDELFSCPRLTMFFVTEMAISCSSLQSIITLYHTWKEVSSDIEQTLAIIVEHMLEMDQKSASPSNVSNVLHLLPERIRQTNIVLLCNSNNSENNQLESEERCRMRVGKLMFIFANLKNQFNDDEHVSHIWNRCMVKWGLEMFENTKTSFFNILLLMERDYNIRTNPVCRLQVATGPYCAITHLNIHIELLKLFTSNQTIKSTTIWSENTTPIVCTEEDISTIINHIYRRNRNNLELTTAKLTTNCIYIMNNIGMTKTLQEIFSNKISLEILKQKIHHYVIMRSFIQLRLRNEFETFVRHFPNEYIAYKLRQVLEECSVDDLEWFFSLQIHIDTVQTFFILLHWAFWKTKVYGCNVEEPPFFEEVATTFKEVVKFLPKTSDTKVINDMCKTKYITASLLEDNMRYMY